jgi:hypothetical protein
LGPRVVFDRRAAPRISKARANVAGSLDSRFRASLLWTISSQRELPVTNGIQCGGTQRAIRLHPEIDREYLVPILLKAAHILEILSEVEKGMSIADLERESGYPKSTIYRIVRTLVVCGYLVQGKSHKYRRAIQLYRSGVRPSFAAPGVRSARQSLSSNSVLPR